MPKDFPRSRRVGDQMQRDLVELLRSAVRDPRLSPLVTIAEVVVSKDLSHAKIYVTVLGGDEAAILDSVDALNSASGFLRHELGKRMKLRSIPQLHFQVDETFDRSAKLSALIAEARAADEKIERDPE